MGLAIRGIQLVVMVRFHNSNLVPITFDDELEDMLAEKVKHHTDQQEAVDFSVINLINVSSYIITL